MKPLSFAGRWVVITGASSGLGEQLARRLARKRARLVLVARRAARLAELARELEQAHGTEAVALPVDLSEPRSAAHLFEAATRQREIYALISNAAQYWFGCFADMPEPLGLAITQLNALTPIALLRRFLPYFDARGQGGALVVTSTGGLMPTPFQALYGASKAMLHACVQSLQYERGGERAAVALCLCCPAGMPTEMLTSSAVHERLLRKPLIRQLFLDPEVVAEQALRAFEARRPLMIPGRLSQLMVLMSRVLPASTVGDGAARVYAE